jgi:hypothetical protein
MRTGLLAELHQDTSSTPANLRLEEEETRGGVADTAFGLLSKDRSSDPFLAGAGQFIWELLQRLAACCGHQSTTMAEYG